WVEYETTHLQLLLDLETIQPDPRLPPSDVSFAPHDEFLDPELLPLPSAQPDAGGAIEPLDAPPVEVLPAPPADAGDRGADRADRDGQPAALVPGRRGRSSRRYGDGRAANAAYSRHRGR